MGAEELKPSEPSANYGLPTKKLKGHKTGYMKRYWQLYVMLLLPVAYFIIFKYIPMIYVQAAWKDYKLDGTSIWKMPWTSKNGWKHFIDIFKNKQFINALKNTITLNLLDLVVGFAVPIVFALILNELRMKKFKKTVQTVAYMPHFLSWVVIYGLAVQLFATNTGVVNNALEGMGLSRIGFLDQEIPWIIMYILIGIWQSFGWNSILYLAAITSINPELYEAASVDGAGRFKKMWHITLPGIRPTIVILLIMSIGNIIGSGFDRPYALQKPLVLNVSEVLSTYIYKIGIIGSKWERGIAIGLFQSVVGVFFLLTANKLARKLGDRGIW